MSMNSHNESLQERIHDWTRDLQPRNTIELFLATLAAGQAHQLEHLNRVAAARSAHHRRSAPAIEATRMHAEVIALGHELIDAAGDEWVRRNQQWEGQSRPTPDPIPRAPS